MLVRQGYDRSGAVGFRSVTLRRRANDVRIDCKAAKHSDGDRGTPPADLAHRTAGGVPPASADCSSSPIGLRANKRRFVNLLQQLAGATIQGRTTCNCREAITQLLAKIGDIAILRHVVNQKIKMQRRTLLSI